MKNKEIMKYEVCSPSLCDIILDDLIQMLKDAPNKNVKDKSTINAIKQVGSARDMILHEYEDKKRIVFTIINEKLKKYMYIKIIFNNEKEETYIHIESNLDRDNFFGDGKV